MKIQIQTWLLNSRDVPGWRTIGHATTLRGAERVARKHYAPEDFGGFRHPDGGPKYGTVAALVDGTRYHWDGDGFPAEFYRIL